MSRQRWGDRIAERICALCGRTGMAVEPWIACWPGQGCMPMDRCRQDFEACQERAEANGIAWPSGVESAAPRRLLTAGGR